MNPIYVIGCGKTKRDSPQPAADLYTGPLFKSALAFARSVAMDSDIYILSARVGLVHCSQVLDPYEQQLPTRKGRSRAWHELAGYVTTKLLYDRDGELVDGRRVIVLAGAPSVELLTYAYGQAVGEVNESNIYAPLKGLGQGQRLAWFKQNKT